MDEAFIMNLAVHMDHEFHLAGEILYRRNTFGDAMHYVLKGYLEVSPGTYQIP
jgi:CRP-like cAMP-binding protein